MKYQLTCTCGRAIPVEVSQAGQTVQCSCGAKLEVPTMRLIRNLPVADSVVPAAKPRGTRPWPIGLSLVFALGMLALVGGLGVATYYQLGRVNLHTDEVEWDTLDKAHAKIDKFTIVEAWEAWTILRNDTIGPYNPPFFVVHRMASEAWLANVKYSLMVAATGLALALIAVLTRLATRHVRPATAKSRAK